MPVDGSDRSGPGEEDVADLSEADFLFFLELLVFFFIVYMRRIVGKMTFIFLERDVPSLNVIKSSAWLDSQGLLLIASPRGSRR